jgi:hypothetical protein
VIAKYACAIIGLLQKGDMQLAGGNPVASLTLEKLGLPCLGLDMMTSQKSRVARIVTFVFVFVLLSVSFAAYKHSVSTGVAKYITFEHEQRRVLVRAERDNFRSGVTTADGGGILPDRSHELAEISPSPQIVATHYGLSLIQQALIEPTQLILDLSPVLNL